MSDSLGMCHSRNVSEKPINQLIEEVLESLPPETPEDRRFASGLELVRDTQKIVSVIS
jgi:hypothetical protein